MNLRKLIITIMVLVSVPTHCLSQLLPESDMPTLLRLLSEMQGPDRTHQLAALHQSSWQNLSDQSKIYFLEFVFYSTGFRRDIRLFALKQLTGFFRLQSMVGEGQDVDLGKILRLYDHALSDEDLNIRNYVLDKLGAVSHVLPHMLRPLVIKGLASPYPNVRFGMLKYVREMSLYHGDREMITLMSPLIFDPQVQTEALVVVEREVLLSQFRNEGSAREYRIAGLSDYMGMTHAESEVVLDHLPPVAPAQIPDYHEEMIGLLNESENAVLSLGDDSAHTSLGVGISLPHSIRAEATLDLSAASEERAVFLHEHPESDLHRKLTAVFAAADENTRQIFASGTPHPNWPHMQDYLLKFLQAHSSMGIALRNPLTLEDFTSFDEFRKSLESSGLAKAGQSDFLAHKLLSLAARVEIYGDFTPPSLAQLEIDPLALKVTLPNPPFEELYARFGDPRFEKFRQLFNYLASDEALTEATPYLDPDDNDSENDCLTKTADVAHFLNELTGVPNFVNSASAYLGFGKYGGTFKHAPSSFRYEMLYKTTAIIKRILEKTSPGDPQQKIFLLQAFMHGGRHCLDAKAHVVKDLLFPSLCPVEASHLEELEKTTGDDRQNAFSISGKLKGQVLDKIINEKLPLDAKESATIKNATWDKLASSVGVPKINSPYPGMALRDVTTQDFLREYTPKKLVEFYKKNNVPRFQEMLGPFANFVGPEYYEFMAKAELIRFGILTTKWP